MQPEPDSTGKIVARMLGDWITFFALYTLFSASWQGAELAVAGIGGSLVAAFQMGLRRYTEQEPELTFSALRPLVSALGELVRDTGRLTGALLTAALMPPPSGGFRLVPVPSVPSLLPSPGA